MSIKKLNGKIDWHSFGPDHIKSSDDTWRIDKHYLKDWRTNQWVLTRADGRRVGEARTKEPLMKLAEDYQDE